VTRPTEITPSEGVCEQSNEENIWTLEGGNNRRTETSHDLYFGQ
jgi:hypothetical protein